MIKPWDEQLIQLIHKEHPGNTGKKLIKKYTNCIPSHHKTRRLPEETFRDIQHIEQLNNHTNILFNLVPFSFHDSILSDKVSILYIYHKEKIDLITIMPILQNLDIHVFDELTTRIGTRQNTIAYIHAFRITHKNKEKIDENKYKDNLIKLSL